MKCNKKSWLSGAVAMAIGMTCCCGSLWGEVVDFEDLTLEPESAWNGADGSGEFSSGSMSFGNVFTDWGGGWFSWEGWAYSNQTDTDTPGMANQFSAYSDGGGGAGGSANYALTTPGYDPVTEQPVPPIVTVPEGKYIAAAMFANTTYAYKGAKEGNDGGANFIPRAFEAGDWFTLTLTGLDENGSPIEGMDPLPIYLGDYRPQASPTYIIDDWTEIDLSGLRGARKLSLSWDSSIQNEYGSVLPAYVAVDNITLLPIPEPGTLWMILCGGLAYIGWRRHRARQPLAA